MKYNSPGIIETLNSLRQEKETGKVLNEEVNNVNSLKIKLFKNLSFDIFKFSCNLVFQETGNETIFQFKTSNKDFLPTSINPFVNRADIGSESLTKVIPDLLKTFLINDLYTTLPIGQCVDKMVCHFSKLETMELPCCNTVYEYTKIISALSNSIYYEVQNNSSLFTDDIYLLRRNAHIHKYLLPYTQLLMVKCEITGIKNYIFNAHEDFSVTSLINRTNYFILLSSFIKKYFLAHFELTEANVLFQDNDTYSFLLPGSLKGKLDQYTVYINNILSKTLNGYIHFSYGYNTTRANELDSINCKWSKILEVLGDKFSSQFRDIHYSNIFTAFTESSSGLTENTNCFNFKRKEINKTQFNIKNISGKYFSILKAFNYRPFTEIGNSDFTTTMVDVTDNLIVNHTHNLPPVSPDNYIIAEFLYENPDYTFNNIDQEFSLIELTKYYRENTLNLIPEAGNWNDAISQDIQIIYKSSHNIILLGSMDCIFNIVKTINGVNGNYSTSTYPTPLFININLMDKNFLSNYRYQFSSLFINGIKLKRKYFKKIIAFGEVLTFTEFTKVNELSELLKNIITQNSSEKDKKEIVIKILQKCSVEMNRLLKHAEEGHLYFDDLYKFKYLLSNTDSINERDRNLLIQTLDEMIKTSLLCRGKISSNSILPAAWKIADLSTRNI